MRKITCTLLALLLSPVLTFAEGQSLQISAIVQTANVEPIITITSPDYLNTGEYEYVQAGTAFTFYFEIYDNEGSAFTYGAIASDGSTSLGAVGGSNEASVGAGTTLTAPHIGQITYLAPSVASGEETITITATDGSTSSKQVKIYVY